jgi:alpha-tubulin suppressor-like RCC1 family protein
MRFSSALVLTVLLAALTMASAAPARAVPDLALAWGDNAFGQLGDGTTSDGGVRAVSGLSGVTAVAAGDRHSLALVGNGTVMAWGENDFGQLGNGTTTGPSSCNGQACGRTPVEVSALSGVTAVAAGGSHSLALLSNGTVMAWGENNFGQLGDGTTTNSDVPVAVSGLAEVTAVAAGRYHSLALLSNGTVMAWGANQFGQLGNGTSTGPSSCNGQACSTTPIEVSGLSGITAVAAGGFHSLALSSYGTVMAWGENNFGQLGDGTITNRDVPVAVSGLSAVTAVSAGEFHSLALLSGGTVMAWGYNHFGELGNASSGPSSCNGQACSTTPIEVSGLSGITAVAAGGFHSLAVLNNGPIMAWGENNFGQLGDGTITNRAVPVAVSGLNEVAGIAAGEYHSLSFGPPPPNVTNVSPSKGPAAGGTTVAISGTNFTGATAVNFGSTGASSFTVNSATSITAVSPAGVHAVDVTVITKAATSFVGSADLFSYVPALMVKGIAPNNGPAAGGMTVTISGTNFTGATAVRFGATSAISFTVNSASSITAVSPPATAGAVDVTVTIPAGTSFTSSHDHFKFGRPTITNLSPDSGSTAGGSSVTVSGTGFAPGTTATRFYFGAESAATVNCTSTAACTVVAPSHKAGTVELMARLNGMNSTKAPPADQFTYLKMVAT